MVKNMRACRILICTIAVLLSFGILLAAQHPVYADAQTSITEDGSEITGFDTAIGEIRRGSVYLELTGEEFLGRKQGAKMSGSRISGYQIQIASNKNFTKNKKTVNVKGYRHTSKVMTGLKSSKDHFARIRTYKKIGNEKLYSPWSAFKKVE